MGIQFASLGRYKKAVSHFESASQLGYSKAQYNLGQCYELGQGVELDLAKVRIIIHLYEIFVMIKHTFSVPKILNGSYSVFKSLSSKKNLARMKIRAL